MAAQSRALNRRRAKDMPADPRRRCSDVVESDQLLHRAMIVSRPGATFNGRAGLSDVGVFRSMGFRRGRASSNAHGSSAVGTVIRQGAILDVSQTMVRGTNMINAATAGDRACGRPVCGSLPYAATAWRGGQPALGVAGPLIFACGAG